MSDRQALAAYYLGLLSLIPVLGALLGPAAFVLGILGTRAPGPGRVHARLGMLMGAVTTLANWGVLLAVFGSRSP